MTIFSCRFHLETCIEKMRKVVGYLVPLVFIRLWMVCSLCACIYNIHSRYSQPCQNDGPPCCPFPPLPSLPLVKPSLLLRPSYSLPCPQIPGNEMQCQAISYDDVLTSRPLTPFASNSHGVRSSRKLSEWRGKAFSALRSVRKILPPLWETRR